MKTKKIFFALASLIVLLASLSFSSAYYYYPVEGEYNAYSYQSHYASGYYGGPQRTTSNYFNSVSSSRYLPDGTRERSHVYTYTTRESPDRYCDGYYSCPRYGYNYGYRSYPRTYYYYGYSPRYNYYW